MYTPQEKQVEEDNYFVLESRFVAKLRTRKVNNINAQLNFINDQSGLSESDKAVINTGLIKLVLSSLKINLNLVLK